VRGYISRAKQGGHNLKMFPNSRTQERSARLGRGLLPLLMLILLSAVSVWSSSPAGSQAPNRPQLLGALIFREVAPGIEHGQLSSGSATRDPQTGPWFINALRIDLRRARLKIVHALDEGVGLETVSSMAARHRALAAINGGYFRTTGTYRGESIGLLLLDGKLISEPHNERAEVGFIDSGGATEVIFGHLKFSGEITAGAFRHGIHGVNRPISPNELIIFTPEFHRTSLTNPDGIEVLVQRNRVVAVSDLRGSNRIPSDGFVVSAVGSARDWVKRHMRRGALAKFSWRLSSSERQQDAQWRRAYSIVGGGPQLIKSGKIAITDVQEKMTAPGFATDRHPRTAIAKLGSGKLILVTVDGRQAGLSVGMSLQALSELLLEFGAVEAINLDGGGSTTMVVQNKVVNRPSDQTGERPVSDAILVFTRSN
jgi:exopolysaccharide biosynthesis protein